MCGRFTLLPSDEDLVRFFGLDEAAALVPRYNIAPTQDVAVVRIPPDVAPGRRRLDLLRWGLIPSWAKDPSVGNRMINARSETAATKPSFRSAFRRRRCLLPASGFFEWRKEAAGKQPYYILRKDEGLLAFAGLWERWISKDGEVVESCTILTTEANQTLRPLHDRMPVILDPEDFDLWLDPNTSGDPRLHALQRPYAEDALKLRRVSKVVGNARNDVPACIEPEEDA